MDGCSSTPIAFLAGVVTAISPCVLPVLPIVFAGGASGGRRRPYAIIAGLVTSFASSLLFATWLLDQLGLPQDMLRNLSIGLLFLVAATLIVPQLGQLRSSGRSRASAAAARQRPRRRLPARREPRARVRARAAGRCSARSRDADREHRRAGRPSRSRSPTRSARPCRCSRSRSRRPAARPRRSACNVTGAADALGVVIGAGGARASRSTLDTKLQTWFPDYTTALQTAVERSCYARKRARVSAAASRAPGSASGALTDYGAAPDFTGISTGSTRSR